MMAKDEKNRHRICANQSSYARVGEDWQDRV